MSTDCRQKELSNHPQPESVRKDVNDSPKMSLKKVLTRKKSMVARQMKSMMANQNQSLEKRFIQASRATTIKNPFNADLFIAIEEGDSDDVRKYLHLGADIEARNEQGETPLITASYNPYDDYEIVIQLLRRGCEVDAQDHEGLTALMKSSIYGRSEIAKLLLLSGADPNIRSCGGNTALFYSAHYSEIWNPYWKGPKSTMSVLLEYGPDPDIQNNLGETAMDIVNDDRTRELLSVPICTVKRTWARVRRHLCPCTINLRQAVENFLSETETETDSEIGSCEQKAPIEEEQYAAKVLGYPMASFIVDDNKSEDCQKEFNKIMMESSFIF